MQVFVNQEPIDTENNTTISKLLKQLNKTHLNGVAVALNNEIIPKKNWENTSLKEKDKITIVTASQGG